MLMPLLSHSLAAGVRGAEDAATHSRAREAAQRNGGTVSSRFFLRSSMGFAHPHPFDLQV
jgi:hypothetical protein